MNSLLIFRRPVIKGLSLADCVDVGLDLADQSRDLFENDRIYVSLEGAHGKLKLMLFLGKLEFLLHGCGALG